jgi:hypothetical protein
MVKSMMMTTQTWFFLDGSQESIQDYYYKVLKKNGGRKLTSEIRFFITVYLHDAIAPAVVPGKRTRDDVMYAHETPQTTKPKKCAHESISTAHARVDTVPLQIMEEAGTVPSYEAMSLLPIQGKFTRGTSSIHLGSNDDDPYADCYDWFN